MTPADIERMAREAGCFTPGASRNYWAATDPMLARFAALVQAAERARWAEVEPYLIAAADGSMSRNNSQNLAAELLAAIRGG